ncbi:ArfGap-domain-containing protein [Suillus weaverae]|nr:ArfGap-domain-containing protein [Suillus weaverae]
MSRQDKTTTERNAKILKDLVKQSDNKVCADCKRNDPRWASWNLCVLHFRFCSSLTMLSRGVFLCIRCSGIHRGMGTHISRVKSVDLDIWTPEQMESIQKWGNRRANLYWESHLKSGHIPPDHKMESFIRSKYESRRWALDGPPPSDPSVLETETSNGNASQAAEQPPPAATQSSRSTHITNASISSARAASPTLQTHITTRQPQSRQLLSSAIAGRAINSEVTVITSPTFAAPQPTLAQPAPPSQHDLFSLDFHAPAKTAASPLPSKDMKSDIMSLFSSAPAAAPSNSSLSPGAGSSAFGTFASPSQPQSAWDQLGSAPQTQPQPTSMMGTGGTGLWGASSGWNASPVAPSQNTLWGSSVTPTAQQPQSQANSFNTNDIWGSSVSAPSYTNNNFGTSQTHPVPKKDDVFGDLWGEFK